MFLLDDILLAPLKGLALICREVYQSAQDDLDQQEKAVLAQIAELFQEFESGTLADADFDAREGALLDRLEAVRLSRGKSEE
ncbi:MAG: gas vesicle protein GvpG [Thermoguttaceae bacterium]|jgi:hypothetical protein